MKQMNFNMLKEKLAGLGTVEQRAEESLRGIVSLFGACGDDTNRAHALRSQLKAEGDALVALVLNGPPPPVVEVAEAPAVEPEAPVVPDLATEVEPEAPAKHGRKH